MSASSPKALASLASVAAVCGLLFDCPRVTAEEKSRAVEEKRIVNQNAADKSDPEELEAHRRNWVRADVLIKNGDVAKLKSLLSEDPGLEKRRFGDANGMTLLHQACSANQVGAIELLLSRGASGLVKAGVFRETPLHIAARTDSVEAVELLLRKGIDIDIVADGIEIPKAAPNFPAPVASALDMAASAGAERVVEVLLSRGAKLNVNSEARTYTALHRAMEGVYSLPGYGAAKTAKKTSPGNKKIIELLLKNGSKITETDYLGNTPFHIGVYKLSYESVEYLLKSHRDMIDVEAEGQFGYTPLQLCVCEIRPGKDKEVKAMIELLHKHGASNASTGGPSRPRVTPAQLAVQMKFDGSILDLLQP